MTSRSYSIKGVASAECLHGGVDFGDEPHGLTSFPQPIGLAAAFDRTLVHEIATIISDEMRAVANLYAENEHTDRSITSQMLASGP